MLYHIKGTLVEKKQDSVVIDVDGIGFEVYVSSTTYLALPEEGNEVMLYIHTYIREDSITLYGFYTITERLLFKLLISVQGIGPKVARNILSNIHMDDFVAAIVTKDLARLSTVPGLGKKTAEKLVLELREKMGNIQFSTNASTSKHVLLSDAVSALVNLGYKQQQSKDIVEQVLKDNPALNSIEDVIKLSLRRLIK
ncbi:MAG: Holliday junction branch migration protein RuvA [bacterium]